MEKIYKENANNGGIYKITNLIDKKYYIGSTKCFKYRAYNHQKHSSNKHLKHAIEKYGSDNFLFEVIEVFEGSREELFELEQSYINKIENWDETYNFNKKVIQKERSCFSKDPEKTRKLMSENSKKNWQNPEYLAKNPCGSIEEKRNRMKKLWSKNREQMLQYVLKDTPKRRAAKEKFKIFGIKTYDGFHNHIENKTYENIKNLSSFCRKHKINYEIMSMVANKKLEQHKGWTLIGNNCDISKVRFIEKDQKEKLCNCCKKTKSLDKFYKRINKNKITHRSKCIDCFVVEHRNKTNTNYKHKNKYDTVIYTFVNNGIKEICTQFEFKKKYNFKSSAISDLISERRKTYRGWHLIK